MSIFNPDLEKMAQHSLARLTKQSFVPTGDPAAGGAPMDPAAAGMDPAAAGGMPMDPAAGGMPMDPAAMGMDPAAAGMDPAAGAAPAGLTEERVLQLIQEAGGAGAGAGAGPGGEKKKVDVGTEMYQIKKMLIFLLQSLGQSVPPDILLGDPAEDPHMSPEQAANDPASAGASPAAVSSIKPIEPIGGASPDLAGGGMPPAEKQSCIESGVAFAEEDMPADSAVGLSGMVSKAAALQALINANSA